MKKSPLDRLGGGARPLLHGEPLVLHEPVLHELISVFMALRAVVILDYFARP